MCVLRTTIIDKLVTRIINIDKKNNDIFYIVVIKWRNLSISKNESF